MQNTLFRVISSLHQRLTDYLRPKETVQSEEETDGAQRFLLLLLLACLLVPFFAFQFTVTGYPLAAVMMCLAGGMMLSSVWVAKATGRLWLARDTFLSSLLAFVTWEAFYFQTIYSPGTVWFVALPVVSVLLGGARPGVIWLGLVLLTILCAFIWVEVPKSHDYLMGDYDLLYMVSVSCLTVAIFLFVLMVDAGRAKAYSRVSEANAEIKLLAERDELTGLLNRRAFLKHLACQLEIASPEERIGMLLADLDGFKAINDTYGHDIGDKLIGKVAEGIKSCAEAEGAVVARLGGDEFAIMLVKADVCAAAVTLAQDILDLVAEPFDIEGRSAGVGISIGIAIADPDVVASELMRRADVAMYEAKRRGKNQTCWHQRSFDQIRAQRLKLAEELRFAIESGEIRVHYQPIVDARTRRITAVEALARWTKRDGVSVPPDRFVSVAEESGLIDKLGMLVLRQACEDVSLWPDLKLSVNLSPVQFRCPTLVEDILRILVECSISPARLELEVTEGYLIEHQDRAQPLLEELHQAGIKISLDDFGTGYSSIGYLRQYAFDRLKIDKSLVDGIASDSDAQGIVQATAILAKSLNLKLTAEGVESEDQARMLQLAGCNHLQGYLFGKPQDAESMRKYIDRQDQIGPAAARQITW